MENQYWDIGHTNRAQLPEEQVTVRDNAETFAENYAYYSAKVLQESLSL